MVLAQYTIRSKQEYIFRTNRMVEIAGASENISQSWNILFNQADEIGKKLRRVGMEILFYQVNVNISISYIRQALAPRTPRVLECSISSKIAIRT